MSPRTKDQNKEIRENRKKVILHTALVLFSREGYHSTSIDSIARSAKISKGLIYNYFTSKEELLNELVNSGLVEMEEYLRLPAETKYIREELNLMIDNVFNMLIEHQDYWKLFSSILVQPDVMEVVSEKLNGMVSAQISMLEDFMNKSGSKTPHEDAIILGALFDGISISYIFNPDGFPLERVKQRIKNIFLI